MKTSSVDFRPFPISFEIKNVLNMCNKVKPSKQSKQSKQSQQSQTSQHIGIRHQTLKKIGIRVWEYGLGFGIMDYGLGIRNKGLGIRD